MPELPTPLFLQAIEALIRADRDWVPTREDGSLYLRPFMFAAEAFLGVRPASEYIFCVIACPVGAYSRAAPFDVGRCCDHRLQETAPARHCGQRGRSPRRP